MDTAQPAGPLSPVPRHMHKRRFRRDFPVSTLPITPSTEPEQAPLARWKASHRRKRLIALSLVILVSVSIPALVLSLIFTR